jgi:hypothetical protein
MAVTFGPDRTGPPWAKDAVYNYVAFVEKLVNELLSKNDDVSANDREQLEFAVSSLRSEVDWLAGRFIEPMRTSHSWLADGGYMALLLVMQAVNVGCSHTIIRDNLKNHLESAFVNARAMAARKAREDQREVRRQAVRQIMEKEKRTRPAISIEYAGIIRDELIKLLPAGSKKPSVSTIRSDVRAILKE